MISPTTLKVERFLDYPVVTPEMDDRLDGNLNGPSLIKVPSWVPNPLGNYYLYFAHHSGRFIRLAYADRLEGPWKVYSPGTLQREEAYCRGHIASPDVHIDEAGKRIVMYYHGVPANTVGKVPQTTMVALSADGLRFTASPEILGRAYWRVFAYNGDYYAVTQSGQIYRSADPLSNFEEGPDLFRDIDIWQRHMAVKVVGSKLYLFYSIKEDEPEHIVVSVIRLDEGDWRTWKVDSYASVLKPETDYEGADLPIERSHSGAIHGRVRQLRDPGIYDEGDTTYLLYSIAGESGLAIAKISGFEP
jgi:hypothetical protein